MSNISSYKYEIIYFALETQAVSYNFKVQSTPVISKSKGRTCIFLRYNRVFVIKG